MSEQDQLADATPAGSAEVFTDLRGWMAQLVVLKDQGHLPNVTFGDDEDSRHFVQDVRRLNRDWKLGQIAKVPTPMVRVLPHAQELVARAPSPRQREHAPRSRRTRTARASRDGPDEPEPARGRPLTALQTALLPFGAAMALAGELDERELTAFLEIVAIRVARETARRWWEAEAA
jgi:hypothetical protein